LLGAAGCAATQWLVETLTGQTTGRPAWIVPALAAAVAVLVLIPAVQMLALPLGDLVEAARRVEAGDLDLHVRPRGARELRALARAFNAMLDRLRQNEVQRRQLLADVTHELRTPVAVLQGNLEAMVDGVYPADAEHLVPLVEETHLLSRLIDDLRTLSLAESGVLELHREPTDLGVLVGEVVAAFRTQAEGAGVDLRADVPDDVPLAEIDPLRLREVLINLTANALRHTPRGGEVRIAVAAIANGLRFSVADTGTGIAPEDLPHVFERFYKTPDSTGSGLGLAIARNLVLAHGGKIEAESAAGRGTTISFSLPLEPPEGPAAAA
ncbi:MAG: ATP-binding protein, partial [Chloroflexi bacterium]|nr:ATP-binding protein [Chloroflexota bacterium]